MSRWRLLFRRRLSVVGLSLLAMFVVMATLAPWLAPPKKPCPNPIYYLVPDWLMKHVVGDLPCQPFKMPRDGFKAAPIPPNAAAWDTFPPDWRLHPFGTTENRYDIYYGIVWGAKTALTAGLLIVVVTFLIGLLVGAVAGFYGGWVESILMRVVDYFFTMPAFLATLVIISVLGPGLDRIVFTSILFGWAGYARFIRGDVLSVRTRAYVDAARALGASDRRLIFKHVVPNMIYPALILASLEMGTIVLGLAGFSFLGLGSGEDYADWGAMISLARNRIVGGVGGDSFRYWYTILFPGVTIFLFILAWNLVGDAVRDVLDPHQHG